MLAHLTECNDVALRADSPLRLNAELDKNVWCFLQWIIERHRDIDLQSVQIYEQDYWKVWCCSWRYCLAPTLRALYCRGRCLARGDSFSTPGFIKDLAIEPTPPMTRAALTPRPTFRRFLRDSSDLSLDLSSEFWFLPLPVVIANYFLSKCESCRPGRYQAR